MYQGPPVCLQLAHPLGVAHYTSPTAQPAKESSIHHRLMQFVYSCRHSSTLILFLEELTLGAPVMQSDTFGAPVMQSDTSGAPVMQSDTSGAPAMQSDTFGEAAHK